MFLKHGLQVLGQTTLPNGFTVSQLGDYARYRARHDSAKTVGALNQGIQHPATSIGAAAVISATSFPGHAVAKPWFNGVPSGPQVGVGYTMPRAATSGPLGQPITQWGSDPIQATIDIAKANEGSNVPIVWGITHYDSTWKEPLTDPANLTRLKDEGHFGAIFSETYEKAEADLLAKVLTNGDPSAHQALGERIAQKNMRFALQSTHPDLDPVGVAEEEMAILDAARKAKIPILPLTESTPAFEAVTQLPEKELRSPTSSSFTLFQQYIDEANPRWRQSIEAWMANHPDERPLVIVGQGHVAGGLGPDITKHSPDIWKGLNRLDPEHQWPALTIQDFDATKANRLPPSMRQGFMMSVPPTGLQVLPIYGADVALLKPERYPKIERFDPSGIQAQFEALGEEYGFEIEIHY